MLDNSLAWGGFVCTSTNLRYQTVNAFEERALVCRYTAAGYMPACLIAFIHSFMRCGPGAREVTGGDRQQLSLHAPKGST